MYRRYFKRFFDIVLSAVAIVVLSPVLIPVVIGLLLTGEHYVFYFQKRIGYKEQAVRHLEVCHDAEKQSKHARRDTYHGEGSEADAAGRFPEKDKDQ